jgi:hypothetical protein
VANLPNANTTWLSFELDFLVENFDGHRTTTETIAELLGRTVKACEARFYEWKDGRTEAATFKNFPIAGGRADRAREARRRNHVDLTPVETCPDCHLALPLTGVCADCA